MNRSRPNRVDPDRSQRNGQPPGQSLDRGGTGDPDLAPFAALLTTLTEVGDLVADEHAAERRAIVRASPELQERGLTKFSAVTSALAAALEQRGARRRPSRSSGRSAPPSSGPRSNAGRSSRNARAWPTVYARRRPS